jgi:hypothetical protein
MNYLSEPTLIRRKFELYPSKKLEPLFEVIPHRAAKPEKLYPAPKRLLDKRIRNAALCNKERYSLDQEHAPMEFPSSSQPHKKPPARASEKFLLSREESAHVLSISLRALDYLIANKILPTRRIGTRVLIPLAAVRQFARGDHPQRIAG